MLATQSVVTVTHLVTDPHPTPTSAVVGEQNEIWNVSAKNTFTMETFLAKTFQIPFCSSLGRLGQACHWNDLSTLLWWIHKNNKQQHVMCVRTEVNKMDEVYYSYPMCYCLINPDRYHTIPISCWFQNGDLMTDTFAEVLDFNNIVCIHGNQATTDSVSLFNFTLSRKCCGY